MKRLFEGILLFAFALYAVFVITLCERLGLTLEEGDE